MASWYVYILACRDRTLYTGITNDLDSRLAEHNDGKRGARYTRSRRPVQLVYFETAADRSAASRRECAVKAMSREQKLELVRHARHQGGDDYPNHPAPEWL